MQKCFSIERKKAKNYHAIANGPLRPPTLHQNASRLPKQHDGNANDCNDHQKGLDCGLT
jgi:hypothetical protein